MRYAIKDIAKLAGVSKATVSRVLNDSKPVSQEVRDRVMKVIEETNYRPSSLARSLSIKETRIIGVIIPDISNPVFSKMLNGIESRAIEDNYTVFLCNTRYDFDMELRYIDLMREKEVDGIIMAAFHYSEEMTERLKQFGKPIVMVSFDSEHWNYPKVVIDNHAAAYEMTSYLIKTGRKKIAMIHGPFNDFNTGLARYKGYASALQEQHLTQSDSLHYQGNYKYETGFSGAKYLIENNKDLDAIFCANDEMAFGAIKALTQDGYRVPEDVAVTGFDDIDFAKLFSPSLTTVRQDFELRGASAVALVLDQIAGKPTAEKIVHDYELIIREST
ncbi:MULTISPECIES: LacI family DNA-binding transcriptional regulator [unclassified Fusibacter]|uniref:LacI family DNA-binding transcriptional regulator n=1 Tax=unclassified Fusibacter TaxID=2624464 RepID=UPI001013516D|nr:MULTISPECIES: LacI family DNA-binding transcriptional regulator [unclassified Fusibacter]MCK8060451.1 LacI family transcriptional regulator [Fusibacter sp. A2]NPE20260.1 LacI family transcriptional regulator [Fusibacter sp. A1]RXV63467.1 LacI family transcriptional regulator [Fusibacter sp. A1]